MKYLVPIESSVVVEADNEAQAHAEVLNAIEDAKTRNCGGLDDEIIAGAMPVASGIEEYKDD